LLDFCNEQGLVGSVQLDGVMGMIDAEFLAIFLDEASEILERWEKACLSLEKEPSADVINQIFRAAHNLKGSARSVGLEALGEFVHKIEDFITRLKNQEVQVNSETVGLILESQRELYEWIVALRDNAEAKRDVTALTGKLLHMGHNSSATQGAEQSNLVSHNLGLEKGHAAVGEHSDVRPPFTSTTPTDLGTILLESGDIKPEQLEHALKLQHRKLGEVLVETGVVAKEQISKALEQQKATGHKPDETIRVSLKKLDSVIRLIGELSIQHSIITNAKESESLNSVQAADAINLSHKVIQDLQSETMSLRMQPLEGLFQRMERVARDVARQQNKKINVVLKGTDVELDKTVIEQMKDPLVHILRNAVDHGIELESDRIKSGKFPTATILIEGIQTATNVTIRISDDGQGLNEEKILQKAKEKGLVDASAVPPSHEIHQMIFWPGFSTAEKVTDVSGRGVGMDVVRQAVNDLSGEIEISSTRHKGTQFDINLPSTLSIMDAIVVLLNKNHYAIPIQDVVEVIDMKTTQVSTTTQKGRVINLRGKILPVESLQEYLPDQQAAPRAVGHVALIARHQHTTVAFEVDRVAGQQSIVVRQLEGSLAKVPGYAGGTILSTGEPSMIIHLPQVVKSYLAGVK
jgi:two-component system, chemotaxis family, sensor kinase CheA